MVAARSRRLVERKDYDPNCYRVGASGRSSTSGTPRRQRAVKKHPNFPWSEYDRILKSQKTRLGVDRRSRRLGDKATMTDKQQDISKEEKALVAQGNALVKSAWDDLEEVKAAVYAAYKGGNSKLDNHEMNAIALIAFNMALDPSPGVGHLYAWKKADKFIVMIGYQGYLHKAQQQNQFVHDTREMTEAERAAHGLKDGEVGAICELYDNEKAQIWRGMGIEPRPITGMAIWRKGDNVPTTKSPLWVAEKNAVKDAIRRLGLGFGSLVIPDLPGFEYDRDDDSFVKITEPIDREEFETEARTETEAENAVFEEAPAGANVVEGEKAEPETPDNGRAPFGAAQAEMFEDKEEA